MSMLNRKWSLLQPYSVIHILLKNHRLTNFVLLLVLSLICSSMVMAGTEPTISKVVSVGNLLTFSGSNFGDKAKAAPLHFDDFAEGTVGHTIGQDSSYWIDPTSIENRMHYSTDYVRVPWHKSGKAVSTAGGVSTGQIIKNNVGFAATRKIYLNYWIRYDWGSSSGNYWQLKSVAICNNVGANGDVTYPALDIFNFNSIATLGYSYGYLANPWGGGGGSNTQTGLLDYAKNNHDLLNNVGWYNFVVQADMGTPGVANGSISVSVSSYDFQHPYGTNGKTNTMVLGDATNTKDIDAIKIWLYHAPAPTVPGTATHYVDSIYIDNSWARVEVCDSSSWATRKHCEVQLATAWANDQITIKPNPGSFTNGEKVYVFVSDNNGVMSTSGFPLIIGAKYPLPAAPPDLERKIVK